jgi:hypothetical protein
VVVAPTVAAVEAVPAAVVVAPTVEAVAAPTVAAVVAEAITKTDFRRSELK